MNYRMTCVTPVLVGDGGKLSAIDYMVWKDHVNVLDQHRIFKLLAKGPRLDGYLAQLKKADKLDFASWGGFAQNFAGRRIPFEHPTSSGYWQRASGESLNIPTFAAGAAGPYVPGAALKGALRTGMLFMNLKPGMLKDLAQRFQGDRPPRRPAEPAEEQALGNSGSSRMRAVAIGDSTVIPYSAMKVYLLRIATLQPKAGAGLMLGWKQSPRGAVDGRRPEESTPSFAEMAAPGTIFEGAWQERTRHARERIFEAANQYAAKLLARHAQYASVAGLEPLAARIADLEQRLAAMKRETQCLLSIGWGGGLLSKTAWIETDTEEYHQILRHMPLYSKAISSGLPFPKTRRIVFEENRPAALPGWVLLEVF